MCTLFVKTVFKRKPILGLCLVLGMMVLFVGCPTEAEKTENRGFIPVGAWTDDWGGGYTITNTTVKYFIAASEWEGTTFPGGEITGNIEIATDFLKDSGVLIIKITSVEGGGMASYTQGKYTCVYYKDYTSSHVFLANPIDAAWNPVQADTLTDAKSIFTIDNVDIHVTNWGSGYNK
jgi:hypothetical protein